jgi:replicative DNA helicase
MNLGLPVGKFSMEMQNREGGQRALASVGHIPLHALRRPERMSDLHWSTSRAAWTCCATCRSTATTSGGLNINQVRAKARKLRAARAAAAGGGLPAADVRHRSARAAHLQLEECTRGLKSLAKELDIPIMCLAQVNRGVEKESDPMPRLSDLKDSGSIEQDADIVLFLHRRS